MSRPKSSPPAESPFRKGPIVWLATGAWIGFAPVAPGTFGSLFGLPLAWAIAFLPGVWLQGAATLALAAVGVPICTAAIRTLGGSKDPGSIVFDEIVGMAASLLAIDTSRPVNLIAGFLLFRLFDIVKPPPVSNVERLPDGLGVMADDCVAAVYANLSLRLLLWIGSYFFAGAAL